MPSPSFKLFPFGNPLLQSFILLSCSFSSLGCSWLKFKSGNMMFKRVWQGYCYISSWYLICCLTWSNNSFYLDWNTSLNAHCMQKKRIHIKKKKIRFLNSYLKTQLLFFQPAVQFLGRQISFISTVLCNKGLKDWKQSSALIWDDFALAFVFPFLFLTQKYLRNEAWMLLCNLFPITWKLSAGRVLLPSHPSPVCSLICGFPPSQLRKKGVML